MIYDDDDYYYYYHYYHDDDAKSNPQPDEKKVTQPCFPWVVPFLTILDFSAKTQQHLAQLLRGIDKLAETVAVTLGPRGRNVLLDKAGLSWVEVGKQKVWRQYGYNEI